MKQGDVRELGGFRSTLVRSTSISGLATRLNLFGGEISSNSADFFLRRGTEGPLQGTGAIPGSHGS